MRGSRRYSISKHNELWDRENVELFEHVQTRKARLSNTYYRWMVYLPCADVTCQLLAFVVCYAIKLRTNASYRLPYILYVFELGEDGLEKNIFSTLTSLSAIFTIHVVAIRFRQISLLCDHWVNNASFIFGLLMFLSKLAFGCFDGTLSTRIYLGVAYFIASYFYILSQVFLTRKTREISTKRIYYTRIVLAEVLTLFAASMLVFKFSKFSYLNTKPHNALQIVTWLNNCFINLYVLTQLKDMQCVAFKFNVLLKYKFGFRERKNTDVEGLIDSPRSMIRTRSDTSTSSLRTMV